MRGEPRPLSRRASSPDRECRACASSRDLLSRPGSDGCVLPLYAQVPEADDGGLGVAVECRYGRGMVARTVGGVMVLCLLGASVGRGDEGGGWRDRVTLIASERRRGEVVDWFRPQPGAADPEASRYAFVASQLRAGLSVVLPHAQLTLVAQDTRLGNLPDDASLPSPVGNLGPGAVYFANTKQRTQGEPFLKLGFMTLRRAGLTAAVGRYEYRDGLETVPGGPRPDRAPHRRRARPHGRRPRTGTPRRPRLGGGAGGRLGSRRPRRVGVRGRDRLPAARAVRGAVATNRLRPVLRRRQPDRRP